MVGVAERERERESSETGRRLEWEHLPTQGLCVVKALSGRTLPSRFRGNFRETGVGVGRWLRPEQWGRRRKRSELSRTVIWLAEGAKGVEAREVGALALNTGWFCSQPHGDTDGKK